MTRSCTWQGLVAAQDARRSLTQLANVRALLRVCGRPGKQLLFMGGEFAQEAEWSESRSLDWWLLENPDHGAVQRLLRDLVYRDTPALWSRDVRTSGFSWIDANDARTS